MLAQPSGRAHLGDAAVEFAREIPELAAAVDVSMLRLRGEGRQRHAFQKLEGVALHQLAILERPGFRFVGIGHQVAWEDVFGKERPLEPSWEARPAPPTQPGGLDFFHHLRRGQTRHRLAQGLEPAVGKVNLELVDIGDVAMPQKNVLAHAVSRPAARMTSRLALMPSAPRRLGATHRSGDWPSPRSDSRDSECPGHLALAARAPCRIRPGTSPLPP